jgi:hypothetical protein
MLGLPTFGDGTFVFDQTRSRLQHRAIGPFASGRRKIFQFDRGVNLYGDAKGKDTSGYNREVDRCAGWGRTAW